MEQTAPLEESSGESGGGLPTFAYIVIAAGALAAVLLVPLVIFFFLIMRKCRESFSIRGAVVNTPIILGREGKKSWLATKWTTELLELKPDEWEIPKSSVILEELLGAGNFGEVHKGVIKGPLPGSRMMKHSICVPVAIKFLKGKHWQ